MPKNENIEIKLSLKEIHRKSIYKLSKETGHSEKQIFDIIVGLGLRQYRKNNVKNNKSRKADIFLLISSLIGITAGVVYILLTR